MSLKLHLVFLKTKETLKQLSGATTEKSFGSLLVTWLMGNTPYRYVKIVVWPGGQKEVFFHLSRENTAQKLLVGEFKTWSSRNGKK